MRIFGSQQVFLLLDTGMRAKACQVCGFRHGLLEKPEDRFDFVEMSVVHSSRALGLLAACTRLGVRVG